MTIQGFRRGSVAQLAAVVTAALIATGTPAAWAGPAAPAKRTTTLTVQSEPAGAAVYLDGRLKGKTPLVIEGIASGSHTVRLVKDGFLEHSRAVSVPASGRSLQVTLTPTRTQPRASTTQAAPGEEKSRGGGKKWLWIGVGAAAVAGLTVGGILLLGGDDNEAPKVTGVTANPTTALMAVTSVSFSTVATDKENDALSYTWDFGDGGTGIGASPSHVYASAGTYNVTVGVTDPEHSASPTTGTTSVTVKSLSGAWAGLTTAGYPFTVNLTQSGTSLSGNFVASFASGPLSGSVASPLVVQFVVNLPHPFYPTTFDGVADSSIDTITGHATDNHTGPGSAFTLTRR